LYDRDRDGFAAVEDGKLSESLNRKLSRYFKAPPCVSRFSMTAIIESFARKTDSDHGEGFVVGHQTAIASQPIECALDYPAPTQDFEPAILVGVFDDFQLDRQPD
jgi:hypothetical protein